MKNLIKISFIFCLSFLTFLTFEKVIEAVSATLTRNGTPGKLYITNTYHWRSFWTLASVQNGRR